MLEVVDLMLLVVLVLVVVRGQLLREIQGLMVGAFLKSTAHTHGELKHKLVSETKMTAWIRPGVWIYSFWGGQKEESSRDDTFNLLASSVV